MSEIRVRKTEIKLARPALAKWPRGWAVLPNPFATTRRYQYTGQGLWVRKWTSSNTSGNTYFVYNENARLIGEYDNAGARVQEIVWLGNLPIGVIAGMAAAPVLHYIESDHLGTPRVIVDATRNVGIWRWNQTNDPFGESTPNQNPDGDATSFTFNLRFAGQYRDSESGWYYNVHRYYDPATGRYLESDPIGLDGGISTYSYVESSPLGFVDPEGLSRLPARTQPTPGFQSPSNSYSYQNGRWIPVARPPGPQPVAVSRTENPFWTQRGQRPWNDLIREIHKSSITEAGLLIWNNIGRGDAVCELEICGPTDALGSGQCDANSALTSRGEPYLTALGERSINCRCLKWRN